MQMNPSIAPCMPSEPDVNHVTKSLMEYLLSKEIVEGVCAILNRIFRSIELSCIMVNMRSRILAAMRNVFAFPPVIIPVRHFYMMLVQFLVALKERCYREKLAEGPREEKTGHKRQNLTLICPATLHLLDSSVFRNAQESRK